ncbi:MAG: Ig-like domain-containing protein, partial [Pararheinheimera sp.]|nr:Ig-like domain-containing protein [Rheinheimera sp.]
TGADGVAKANLSSSVDPSLRKVTVTASVGDKSATIDVDVVGTSILIAAPRSMVLSDEVTVTADLTDFDGKGIQGQILTVTSKLGNPITRTSLVTAGNSGRVSFVYRATQGGADELTVTGLGATAAALINIQSDQFRFLNEDLVEVDLGIAEDIDRELSLEWLVNGNPKQGGELTFITTRGTVSDSEKVMGSAISITQNTNSNGRADVFVHSDFAGFATIVATEGNNGSGDVLTTQTRIEFVAKTPDTIEAQAFPAQLGPGEQSIVRAIVRDENKNPVKNQTVAFTLVGAPGGQINPSTAVTNSQGLASTVFTADNTTGAGTGHNLNVQATLLDQLSISKLVPISVGSRTLFFRFGTGNTIKSPSNTLFAQEFSVLVTDSSGNPVAGQDLNVSVLSLSYDKGWWKPIPDLIDFEYWYANREADDPRPKPATDCPSEDVNNNGILDDGEDSNGNGQLTPGNVTSVPRTVTANSNGIATFDLTYPRDIAPWTKVLITVSGFADGTENISSREFETRVSGEYVADENAAPASNPYGEGEFCTDTK